MHARIFIQPNVVVNVTADEAGLVAAEKPIQELVQKFPKALKEGLSQVVAEPFQAAGQGPAEAFLIPSQVVNILLV